MTSSALAYGYLDTPIGRLLVAGDGEQLHAVVFPTEGQRYHPHSDWRHDDQVLGEPYAQLRAYFAGELTRFELPLHFTGTAFQNTVWQTLCTIPFGETTSYGVLAGRIGRPKAQRAVGAANGANPMPIVVPCHRVLGADRSLTGFGGGIEIKKYLLTLEGQTFKGK
jgi:methylated-DNA-[protein]-cysteine S-methyltransferase